MAVPLLRFIEPLAAVEFAPFDVARDNLALEVVVLAFGAFGNLGPGVGRKEILGHAVGLAGLVLRAPVFQVIPKGCEVATFSRLGKFRLTIDLLVTSLG